MCEEQKTPTQLRAELVRNSRCKPFTDESFDRMVKEFSADPLISSYCAFRRKREGRSCYEKEVREL